MATKGAFKRLQKEYINIQRSPPPYITAKPLESNILEWHYIIRGPESTPYEGGEYHGKLVFPADYPFKPPSIRIITPSGRFQTDTRLCLTMSDFHPSSWNPAWSVSTILNGLLSFMVTDETTTGSIKTTDAEKRMLAVRSHPWNLSNPRFREVWPDFCTLELGPIPNSQPKQQPETVANRSSNASSTALEQTLGRRNHGALASQPSKQQQQQQQQQHDPLPVTANGTPAIVGQPSWFASTFGQWRRWLLLFVVCVYLLAARIFARAGGSV